MNYKRYLQRIREIWNLKGGEMGIMKRLWEREEQFKKKGGKIRKDENGEAEIITDEFEGMDSFQKDQEIADRQGLL